MQIFAKILKFAKDLERRSDEDLSMLAVAEAVVPLRRLVFGYLARRAGWKYVFDRSFELCYAGMMTVCEQRMPPDLAKISVSENALTRKVLAKVRNFAKF